MKHWKIIAAGCAFILFILIIAPVPRSLLHGEARTLRILDRNGALLYEQRKNAPGSQEWLPFEHIPAKAVEALIDTEDRTFLTHPGVSLRGTIRALYLNLLRGEIVSGGSTITQQLVRVRLQGARNLWSKILETYFALKIELRMSKEEILEAYLNSAYFGHQAYGIEAAAHTYAGKTAAELSLNEMTVLIGLLQSPSNYDPFTNMARARERQKTVLAAMRSQGHISPEEEKEAASAEFRLAPDRVTIEAPHFVFWILGRDDLPANVTEIRTTLDLHVQHEAERAVENHLQTLGDKNVTSAAVVVLDARTGDVLAMVGSLDYFDAAHDGAVNVAISPRQPGSAIKPFTYALALTAGDTAATTVADIQTQFFTEEGNPYIPRNYDFDDHGLVRYREALSNSYNIAAVKVLERVGVARLLPFLRSVGISGLNEAPEHYGLALTLGDAEVSLLELTRAFGIFPREGKTLRERSLSNDPLDPGISVLSPQVSWLISDILSDDEARLPQFGDQGPLNFPFPVAAKTGTTRNSRDNWTIGYTPSRIVGVWVGNADNSPMKGTSGITGAGPIFHDVMTAAVRDLPEEAFIRPEVIIEREICAFSGKLPTGDCPRIMTEYFITGTEPTEPDDFHRGVLIDTRNGLRASDSCPPQYVTKQVFTVFPPEIRPWARERGFREPPTETSPFCGPDNHSTIEPLNPASDDSWLMITRPSDHDSFELDPLVPNKNEKIIFEANADPSIKTVDWSINNQKIGTGRAPDFRIDWQPQEGEWTLEAKSGNLSTKRQFSVHNRDEMR